MYKLGVKIKKLPHCFAVPEYATPNSSGVDLYASFVGGEPQLLHPKAVMLVPTGICITIPEGYEAQVRPRSGLAFKHYISVNNSPGTIDSDYRGEIKVILINHGPSPFTIKHGDRIAQLVFCPVIQAKFELVNSLNDTNRGDGGFGSTGV